MSILQTIQTPYLYYVTRVLAGVITDHGDLMNNAGFHADFALVLLGVFWSVLWCIKASFLALYWRLFQRTGPYKKWWKAVTVFTFLAYVGCWITSVNVCHPLDSALKNGSS